MPKITIPSYIKNQPAGANPNISSSPGSSHPKTNPFRIILFIVSLLVIGGIAVYYFMFYQNDDNTIENTNLPVVVNENQNTNMNATIKILDCGNDINCLIQASEDCTPAKVSYTTTMELGVQQTTKSYFELKMSDQNKCILYLRTDKIDLVFPDNVSQEIVDEQNEFYDSFEGLDGTCEFSTTDLTAVLTNWKNGNFDSGEINCQLSTSGSECEIIGGDFGVAECNGAYFEQLTTPDSNLNINQNTNYASNTNNLINLGTTELTINEGNINIIKGVFGDDDDADDDGLLTSLEEMYGTSADIYDTDEDGYNDFIEVSGCYNPLGSGIMPIEIYDKYINSHSSGLADAGIITENAADHLNDLWIDYIKEEIAIKQIDSNLSYWDEVDGEEIVSRCDNFNLLFEIEEEEDEFITICQSSLLFAMSFCNPTELSY